MIMKLFKNLILLIRSNYQVIKIMKTNLRNLIVLIILLIIFSGLVYIFSDKKNLPDISNTYFHHYNGTVTTIVGNRPLPDVDIKTFVTLSYLVGKDKNHVYIEDRIQSEYDAQTFDKYGYLKYLSFFKDKNGIYYLVQDDKGWHLKPSPIDPNEVSEVGNYIKAPDGIYYKEYGDLIKIKGIDTESFRVLGTCVEVEMYGAEYLADKNHVYVGGSILEGVNPDFFKKIAEIKSVSDSEIPYFLTVWSDNKNLYVNCGILMKEADLVTFKYLGDNKGEDKNYFYHFNTGNGYDAVKK